MKAIEPKAWAQQLATELVVGGERIPFERVMVRHRDAIASLRLQGLTWAGIARLLSNAGVHRPSGALYSADHLRVMHQRLAKEKHVQFERVMDHPDVLDLTVSRRIARPDRSSLENGTSTAKRLTNQSTHAKSKSGQRQKANLAPDDDKDISADELERALSHLKKSTP